MHYRSGTAIDQAKSFDEAVQLLCRYERKIPIRELEWATARRNTVLHLTTKLDGAADIEDLCKTIERKCDESVAAFLKQYENFKSFDELHTTCSPIVTASESGEYQSLCPFLYKHTEDAQKQMKAYESISVNAGPTSRVAASLAKVLADGGPRKQLEAIVVLFANRPLGRRLGVVQTETAEVLARGSPQLEHVPAPFARCSLWDEILGEVWLLASTVEATQLQHVRRAARAAKLIADAVRRRCGLG